MWRMTRMTDWLLLALAVWLLAPGQLPVSLYKLSLVAMAAVAGYWIDRALFPYSRPDGYLACEWRGSGTAPDGQVDFPLVSAYHRVFAAALLRRAIIVAATMLAVGLGA
jgi:hypothetical protein